MSGFMGDLTTHFAAGNTDVAALSKANSQNSAYDLDMQDFLTLMITQLQSQSIDNTADTSEMLNQMVMMQMVSALTNMTDASVMSYAASLVGKTVTVGQYDSDGVLQEIVGEVTGTGSMGGEQVVFVGEKYYYMSEIMAVGTLPEVRVPDSSDDAENGDAGDGAVDGVEGAGTGDAGTEGSDDTVDAAGGTENQGTGAEPGQTEG